MNLSRFIMLGSALLITFSANAETATEHDLAQFLAAQQQALPLQVDFVQKRSIQGLPRPLRSEGSLTITATQVLWHTQQPMEQQLTITAEGITAGAAEQRMRGSEMVAQLLLAVLQGDAEALQQNFNYQVVENCLNLQPKATQLQQFIEQISSCGQAGIEQVTIEETQGNRSVITFSSGKAQADGAH